MKTLSRFACAAALLSLASALHLASAARAPDEKTSPPPKDAAEEKLADGDFKIEPPYTDAPELTVKDGVPKGTIHEFTMDSQDSKIYPGLTGPYKRKVAVYVPPGYAADTPAPFIVVQDAMAKGLSPRFWTT